MTASPAVGRTMTAGHPPSYGTLRTDPRRRVPGRHPRRPTTRRPRAVRPVRRLAPDHTRTGSPTGTLSATHTAEHAAPHRRDDHTRAKPAQPCYEDAAHKRHGDDMTDTDNVYPGRPGDMFQDDDGGIYVHCADGRLRLVDDQEDPYTPAGLDDERGPLLPIAGTR